MTTQISGKYSLKDNGIFDLKQKLSNLGISVSHPIGDKIEGSENGIPIAFNRSENLTFYDVELDFYKSIQTSSFHIVHNKFLNTIGYVGKSVSIELCYAMLFKKPIIILYNCIVFNKEVDERVIKIIDNNKDKFIHISFEDLPKIDELMRVFEYDLGLSDKSYISETVNGIIESYRQ